MFSFYFFLNYMWDWCYKDLFYYGHPTENLEEPQLMYRYVNFVVKVSKFPQTYNWKQYSYSN